MDNTSFVIRSLTIGFLIGMLVLLTVCCIGSFALLNNRAAAVEPTVNPLPTTGPIAPTPMVGGIEGSTICRYADGIDSYGKVVAQNTTIIGPAVIKPSRDRDHAILLLPGSTYVTTATKEVVWALQGDAACVMSQGQFFSTTEVR